MARSAAVTPLAELVDQRRAGWFPTELGPRLGGLSALAQEEDLGEVLTHPCASLFVRTRHSSRSASGDCRRLGNFCRCRIQTVAEHVVALRRLVLEDTPEEVRHVGHVHG